MHLILWGSNWNSTGAVAREQLETLFYGLSNSAYQGILTQYTDGSARVSPVVVGPVIYNDTGVGAPTSVNNASVEAEVAHAVSLNGWSRTANSQFVVIPAPGSTYESGFDKDFCGYHGVDGSGSSYTFVAYAGDAPFTAGCSNFDPEKNVNNVTSMVASHEYAESATDPFLNAWYTSDGYEVADICASGDDVLPNGAVVQGLWDNRQNACSLSDPAAPAPIPAAVLSSGGTEYTYFRGENGAIWQADSSGNVQELGGSAAGNPVAVVLSSGERDVYFRGTNGSIWRWYLSASTHAWSLSQVGGVTVGEPSVAAGYPYSVFFRQGEGCQRCVYQSYLTGGSWSTRALGGDIEGTPVAVTTSTGTEKVFWSHTGTGVIEDWSSTSPMSASPEWSYSEVGGTATAERPTAVVYSSGKQSVYFQAKEGCILCVDELYWNGSSWGTKWGTGQLGGGPVAEPESETEQRVYWRGSDGAIWYNYGNPSSGPWSVERLGGTAGTSPSEIYNSGGSVSTSLYYFDQQSEGFTDLYYQSGAWHFKSLCSWPCPAAGAQTPHVTVVSPNNGSGTGGATVAITGSYFTGATSVKFGDTNATSFTVNSSTSITAVAPAGTGTVDVTVVNSTGTSPITAADHFVYAPYATSRIPSGVLMADGTEYVYYRGENGAIWQADPFGGIKELGGSAAGNPVAVALSSGERDIYFRGTNGAIWRWYFNPSDQTWSLSQIGGVTVGEPTVAAGYPYSVFFRQGEGCQRCVYQSYLSGGSWATRALGGDIEGTPVAVTTSSGTEEVFWGHTGTGVIEEWSSATPMSSSAEWHYSEAGGTATTARPAAVVYPSGTSSVYLQAKEGCILCVDELYWNGSSWGTKWGTGQLAGGPVAAAESETEQRVYWRGSDGAIWYNYGDPATGPWNVARPGGTAGGDPAEVYDPGATVSTSLYYFDQTGGLTDLYTEGGEWQFKQLCAYPCSSHSSEKPTVTGLSPSAGLTTGGSVVTISGEAFSEVSAVKFGSSNATSFTVNSSTSITAIAPAGTGTVDVTVSAAGGTSATASSDQYTYVPEGPGPTVKKVAPTSGPADGGTSVTITGTEFIGVIGVKFGSTNATSYTVSSSTSITAMAPAGAPAMVDVTVKTPNGNSAISTKDHYKYTPTVESVTPSKGPAAGGTSITIIGTGFALGSSETAFKIGATKSKSVDCTSSTTCVVVTPAGEAGVAEVVAIVNKEDSPSNPPGDEYTYE